MLFPNPNTGEIYEVREKVWILNPECFSKLSVGPLCKNEAEKLKACLDASWSEPVRIAARNVADILHANGAQCQEIDDYLKKFSEPYLKTRDELLGKIPTPNSRQIWECKREAGKQLRAGVWETPEALFEYANLFNLIPSELRAIQLKDLPKTCKSFSTLPYTKYINEYARILAHHYFMTGYSLRDRQQIDSGLKDGFIKGVSIMFVEDNYSCGSCRKLKDQKYRPGEKYPEPPFHIGCRCSLLGISKKYN